MQVNNGPGRLPVFMAPSNGSAGYAPGRIAPVRSPPPAKAPPPPPLKPPAPPLKPSVPPPANSAAFHLSEARSRREHAQNQQRKNTYICTGVFLGALLLTLILVLSLTTGDALDENCPDQDLTLRNWNPGQNPKKAVVVGSGERLRLASSATLQSLTILSGGSVVFADNKDGSKNITLQTRHVLIDDGGSLHIGGPKCRYRSRATITLVGRSDDASIAEVPVFGRKFVGVRAGGTLELHGVARPSWTFLTRTVPASGLATGGYAFQKNFSRGINLRVLDQDTGTMLTDERFDTHDSLNDSRRLGQQLRSLPPGRIVALAVGDSAVKSLLEETKKTIQELLGSSYVNDLKYRQAWALVAVVGGGNGSCTEDTREHENHDTGGRALARRDFVTVDGVRFSVTAYSEWRNGFPISGFQVDAVDQVVLNLQDDVSSWRAGERIVVASTDYSMHQAEEFTLLPCPHCTKRQVRIQGKPQFTHMGEIVDGVDMRAEVALLSRNILIQGEMERSCYGNNWCQYYNHDTFGGHVKVLGNFSSVHLSQVELKNMGQQAVRGSYPVHFHLCGDVDQRGGYTQPTYLDSLSIHHSFSRCVTVHATNGLLVRDTVGYDTLGHCFFLEDGIEQRNTFFHNLGLVTRPGTILPTDRNDTMCTEIRDRVYKGYNPSPATECKAVSTFWIANPNNNLINNAAAGSQDAGIWYIFHSSSTGDTHGLVPETKAELTPLGIFYNNRVHSNFKAGLFIDKGVKTTNATAADPREYLCLDNNARFRPHEDSDPTKPRVAALIDTLISFKNNDLGAWIRGGDIIIQNSGFADNGVGLSFASDGSYPKDVGSSQEVSESLFVGESKNRGSNGGQNKYWGVGGVDGRMRTLPRNKTFPIRGFQIYDGPVRLLQSTFKSYMPTSDRFTSAVGFNLKNVWQLTPRNNLSSLSFLPSVTLRAFFGRPGQWFEENDLDGDKNSIFHDLDGSVSGYPDTYVARADNFLIRHPECVLMPQWNGCVCSGRYAQVYIKTTGVPNLSLSIIRDEYPDRPMVLRGINSQAAPSQQYQPVLMMSKSYTLHWNGQAPREIVLSLANFDVGDWALLGLCYPPDTVFQVMSDIYNRQTGFDGIEDYGTVSSLDDLEKRALDRKYFFDKSTGLLWLYARARYGRVGHSYCSVRGCERVKITATSSTKQTCNCTSAAYPKHSRTPSAPLPMPRPAQPCTRCGASQVAFSSDPSISFIQTQIKSLSLAEEQNNDTQAFIAVNNQRYDLAKTGFFTVSVDACTGKVNKYSFFPKLDSKMEQHFKSGIPVRSIVLLASRGQPAGIAGVAQYLVPLGAAKVADLQGRASLAFFGFQGSSPLQPWVSLVLSRGEEAVGMQERYIPLSLVEYACPPPSEPPARKDLELLRKALS
ncbi:cell surface hyaluronidase [Astyanax mexicanus]|uniref:cell surface hyaluronidase n=1 Tax=Astyanax mexicanus TaxID=7994 RepID=UPI0020CB208A|nr:cell surface hyaluronidase [Astyanax mexicanus]